MKIVRGKNLREKVYDALLKLILNSTFAPGAILSENDLVKLFGVSRTPLREALSILEAEGLIVRNPNGKLIVYSATIKETEEMYYCRAALEGLAVRSAIDYSEDKEIIDLTSCYQSAYECYLMNDIECVIEKNMQFHDIIIKASRNKLLIETMERLSMRMGQQRSSALRIGERYNKFVSEHKAILDSITSKEQDLAQKLIYDHIIEDKNAIIKLMKQHIEGKEENFTPRRSLFN